ncbi:YbaB/EbfC family nucleoid-associated protein [Streptomyces sp. HPF1205]|uniref:YbaB/EbfC family nucleoid-associated protein n=1 Tax=Streptomyces sp. HPF1205 TaxID=2873262 RepID=UPI001CEC6974|nr:YbaB/EbfC family nucleoid-associated protein [Streptomyces sp. HPF1205]
MDLDDAAVRRLLDSTRQFQRDFTRAQAELGALTVQGTAGGGAVTATVDSGGVLTGLTIAPFAADPDNVRDLADMILSALRDARQALTARREERLRPLLESLDTDLGRGLSG